MGYGYSQDLRKRIVATFDEGHSLSEVAEMFKVGVSTVRRYVLQWESSQSLEPQPHRGGARKSLHDEHRAVLRRLREAEPDALIADLTTRFIAETGLQVHKTTIGRELRRMGYTRKKKSSKRPSN